MHDGRAQREPAGPEETERASVILRTSICTLLGIDYPLLGAPMGGVALSDLAGAVSEAGGLGIMGLTSCTPDEIADQIRRIRMKTRKPFGVGLMFPGDIPSGTPKPPESLPGFLDPLWDRVKALPAPPPPPTLTLELARAQLEVVVRERVPLLACGLGAPAWVVEQAHAAGIKVASLVGSVRAARAVDALGVDLIVAQGHEAGGHTGSVTTLVLVPQVVDAVRAPVVAAGGIGDGRGLAAALVLGAQGALIGTRLLATVEAHTAQGHKARIVAMEGDETTVSRCYTGKPSRVIRNTFTTLWERHQHEILPMPAQRVWMAPIVGRARAAEILDIANYPTGQVAGLVRAIRPARDVVHELVDGAIDALTSGLAQRVGLGRA